MNAVIQQLYCKFYQAMEDWGNDKNLIKAVREYPLISFMWKVKGGRVECQLLAESRLSYSTFSFGVLGEIISQQNAVGKDKSSYCL